MTENPYAPEPVDAERSFGAPSAVLAPVGKRVMSHLIDLSIPTAIYVGAQVIVMVQLSSGNFESSVLWPVWLSIIAMMALGVYQWHGVATTGQSIGKRVMGVWTLDAETGQPIGWGRAFLRWTVLGLLSIFWIPILLQLFVIPNNPRRQGWHDSAVGTVVVMGGGGSSAQQPQPASDYAVEPRDDWGAPAEEFPAQTEAPPLPEGLGGSLATGAATAPPPAPVPAPLPTDSVPPAPGALDRSPASQAGVGQVPPPPPLPGITPPPGPPVRDERSPLDPEPVPSPPADHTVLSNRLRAEPPRARWRLVAEDGTKITVSTAVVVGRDPSASLVAGAVLTAVPDPQRTMSKTHAALRLVGNDLTVEDLHSTNGVYVVVDGEEQRLPAGEPHTLEAGQVVSFGDRVFSVERAG